jgi:hypothetical protein
MIAGVGWQHHDSLGAHRCDQQLALCRRAAVGPGGFTIGSGYRRVFIGRCGGCDAQP